MPRVVGTTPTQIMYETATGQTVPVARGMMPDLDAEADNFDRMGGASAGPMMANAAPDPTLAALADRAGQAGQAAPLVQQPTPIDAPAPTATDAPTGFAAMAQGAMAPPARAPVTAEEAQQLASVNAAQEAARGEMRPGPTFSGAQQPGGAPAGAMQYSIGTRARGGGAGGPRQTTTMRQEIAAPIDPSYGEAIGAAAREADEAGQDVAYVAQMRAREEARIREDAARQQQAANEGRQQAFDRHQQRVDQQRAVIDADVQRYQDLASDPFAGKGTDAKITAIIGVALGGLGAAIAGGGPNQALALLQEQMATEREAAREKIRSGQGRLAELRDQLGSEQAALDAHMAGLHERLASRLTQVGADVADTEIATQVDQQAAQQKLLAEQARAQAAQAAAGRGEITTEQRRGFGGGGRPRQVVQVRTQNGDIIEVDAETALRTEGIREHILPQGEAEGMSEEEIKQQERYAQRMADIDSGAASVQRVLDRARASGGDLAGFGRTQSIGRRALSEVLPGDLGEAAANMATSEEGIRNRTDIDYAIAQGVTALTGANSTPEQEAVVRARFGLVPGASSEEILRGLEQVATEIERQRTVNDAGVSPRVVESFRARAGRQGAPATAGAPVVRGR